MLQDTTVVLQIPVVDLERALDFYVGVLGLNRFEMPELSGIALLGVGGTQVMLYQRAQTKADHTIAAFVVDGPDIEPTVDALTAKGVEFEQYELNDLVRTNAKGIAQMGPAQAAWFRDTEGNILALNNKL
ncbi:MAG: VOC family protein [Myxococcota bacterium]